MAICEIRTSGDNVPKECTEWQDEHVEDALLSLVHPNIGAHTLDIFAKLHAESAEMLREFVSKLKAFEAERSISYDKHHSLVRQEAETTLKVQTNLLDLAEQLKTQQQADQRISAEAQIRLQDATNRLSDSSLAVADQIELAVVSASSKSAQQAEQLASMMSEFALKRTEFELHSELIATSTSAQIAEFKDFKDDLASDLVCTALQHADRVYKG
ncbi:hypothetical protein OIO90_000668 [Microbotryomycetes sp. JL221]|nr:hypothetical protein OIO90_000668 [Microbotryomycetes sp. JL221]